MNIRDTKNSTGIPLIEESQFLANIQKHIVLDFFDKKLIASLFTSRNILKKELLLYQGQICSDLFFVEHGSLRAFNLNEGGKEAAIMFAVQDWWITDMHGFIYQKPALVSLEALEDSKVLVINFKSFEALLEKIPKFERFFRILFQNAYVREQQRVLDNISLSSEQRYNSFVKKYPQIVKRVTQKQIASYLGITPEFLSAIKKKKEPLNLS